MNRYDTEMHLQQTDDVILTTYFTGMPDPQRSVFVDVDDYSKLQILDGCIKLGLKVIIFHDQLSENFVSTYSCDSVLFIKVETDTTRSVNDYRFFVFKDWLAQNACRNVFCSDAFDVRVNLNPHRMVNDSHHLWVGIHRDWNIDYKTADGRHVAEMMERLYGSVPEPVHEQPILMAGTWGGKYKHVLNALVLLTKEIDEIHSRIPRVNCNLAAFNHVVYRDIKSENVWMEGAPLHSEFRAYDYEAEVCFVHK